MLTLLGKVSEVNIFSSYFLFLFVNFESFRFGFLKVQEGVLFFADSVLISSQVQFFSLNKRKTNSTTEQRKCKGHAKRDRLLIAKMEFNYQIFLQNKVFTY